MIDPPAAGRYPSVKVPGARVIGHFLNASSRTATRSLARASVLSAAFILATVTAHSAQAQVPSTPDTVRSAPRVDTTNNLVMTSDTTQEVKHVVKKGDTLWDLAQFYLKNPFRWPEIFRRNTDVVKDPHWIYPGEASRIWVTELKPGVLAMADSAGEVVSRVVTRPLALSQQQQQVSGGRSDRTVFASPMSRAAAALQQDVIGRSRGGGVRKGEVEAAPYGDREPRGAGRLIASVDRPGIKTTIVQSRYQINDDLYVDLPRGAVARLGDTYMSYVVGPDLGDNGKVIIPTGILRIENIAPGQRPVARIVRQFAEIMLDQRVTAAPDLNVPSGTMSPAVGGARGKVVYVHNEPVR